MLHFQGPQLTKTSTENKCSTIFVADTFKKLGGEKGFVPEIYY